MKRLTFIALALAVFGAGCDDDSPNAPSNTVGFSSQLTTANEVPPVTNAESSASGSVSVILDVSRSGNTITGATATFAVNMSGFPSTTTITAAHIHQAGPGVNAGVKIDTGLPSGSVSLVNGAGSFTRSGINVAAADAQALIDNPGGHYFNVHTSLNPGGVIRGQLTRTN